MEIKKLENRYQWICKVDGCSYVRAEIMWGNDKPNSIVWHLNEDERIGENTTGLNDDELEELFWKVNPIARMSAINIMENYKSLPTNSMKFLSSNAQVHNETELIDADLSYLDILIKEQKTNNFQLRKLSDNLHQLVKGLNGELPREIYEYDKKEELVDSPYLERLSENSVYYKALIEDIEYSIHHLETYIK